MAAHTPDEVQNLIKLAHLKCVPNDQIAETGFCGDKINQLLDDNKKLQKSLENFQISNFEDLEKISKLKQQSKILESQKENFEVQVQNLMKQIENAKKHDTSNNAIIESEMDKLQEENEKFKNEIEKLKNENLKIKNEKNENSANWIWILSILMGISTVGFIAGYLYYNRMFIFTSRDDERLT